MWNDDYKREMDQKNPSPESLKNLSNILNTGNQQHDIQDQPKKRYSGIRLRYVLTPAFICSILLFLIMLPGNDYIQTNKDFPSETRSDLTSTAPTTAQETPSANYDVLYDALSTIQAKQREYYDYDYDYEDSVAAEPEHMPAQDENVKYSASEAGDAKNNLDGELNNTNADSIDTPSEENPDYSDTNLQVLGVQEADIIKTDGTYIYALSKNSVYIVSATNGNLALVSKIEPTASQDKLMHVVSELYITKDRLVILKNLYENRVGYSKGYPMMDIDYEYNYYGNSKGTGIEIYDISDKTAPKKVNDFGQSGDYASSRMIGDILYLVSNQYIYHDIDKDKPDTFVPELYNGETKCLVEPQDIHVNEDLNYSDSQNHLVITGIKISGEGKLISSKSLFGYGSSIYANKSNLYIASYTQERNRNATKLIRLSLDEGNIEKQAEGMVPGTILNQFSMDEYNNVFRIVTTVYSYYTPLFWINESWQEPELLQYNCLYTLNADLEIIGKIENLAKDERVYSVRFDGDTGYFVTFREVDPLFTVDLSDPLNPVVLSELKIPGFSEYLHLYGDGLLFGLGRDADEKTGRTGYMKLSMFDTSNPHNTTEKHNLIIKGKYYSEAAYNHKAILINAEKNIIAFPAEDEYLLYSYSEKDGFIQEAAIYLPIDIDDYFYGYYESMRGLYIGDYLYVISTSSGKIGSYSLKDFQFCEILKFSK